MKYSKSKPTSVPVLLILSISILGFIFSLFTQFVIGLNDFSLDVKSQMKVYVYMEDSLSTTDLLKTKMALKSKNYIDFQSGNSSGIEFVSKNKIAEDFLKSSHENYQELLGDENPFKNMFILSISEPFKNTKSFQQISKEISSINGVYEVTFPNNYLDMLMEKIKSISYIILVLGLLLIIFIYVQISNYIRIAIHANRVLIKTMQLLGSTNTFIQKPYLFNALKLGILGSVFGYIFTNILFYGIQYYFPSLTMDLFNLKNQLYLIGISSISCLFFCFISTFIALNKYFNIQQSNIH
ncbi:cell division protein FtsX [Aquirufa sp. ROCK2-A2]